VGGVLLGVQRFAVEPSAGPHPLNHRILQLGGQHLGLATGAVQQVEEVGQDQAHRNSLAADYKRCLPYVAPHGFAARHKTEEVSPMLVVHHLNDSRSQRILWLLEELGAPYGIKHYARDATTRLAPPELKAVHPLGKSPAITDGPITIAESGAIVDYIQRKYGGGKLGPPAGEAASEQYNEWLHYSEGSAMLPLMLNMYVGRLGEAGAPLHPRIQSEMANHLSYVEGSLKGRDWLMGDFSAADIQMSFVGEVARAMGQMETYPNIKGWVTAFQARPAYVKALEKGGAYNLGPAK